MINGKPFTVAWHVDDLKISHEDSKEVDKFIEWTCDKYEDENGKIKLSCGKKHKYLGMSLDYSVPGELKIDMKKYVQEIIESFPDQEIIKKQANTPASNHLFMVRENGVKIR